MTIKVNLSPSDINTFKFNDTVFIKNRTFRVNKIDYKPNDLATVEFILNTVMSKIPTIPYLTGFDVKPLSTSIFRSSNLYRRNK